MVEGYRSSAVNDVSRHHGVGPIGFEPPDLLVAKAWHAGRLTAPTLLVGAWRGVESVPVHVGGTPGARGTTASMPSTAGVLEEVSTARGDGT